MKPEITYVRTLSTYRDYTDTQVYQYKSDRAEFYFDAYFANEQRVDGKNIYDVAVSLIGKKQTRLKDLVEVPDIAEVRERISMFFKEHGLALADGRARDVYFK